MSPISSIDLPWWAVLILIATWLFFTVLYKSALAALDGLLGFTAKQAVKEVRKPTRLNPRTAARGLTADLREMPGNFIRGTATYVSRPTGETEFLVRFNELHVADNTALCVVVNDENLHSINTHQNAGRAYWHSSRGDAVPTIRSGDRIQIELEGQPLLAGDFEPD